MSIVVRILAVAMALGAVIAAPAAGAPKLTTLHRFTGGKDGGNPHGGLLLEGRALYGTTETAAPQGPASCSRSIRAPAAKRFSIVSPAVPMAEHPPPG